MKDTFLNHFKNPNSPVYGSRGAGYVPAKYGCWVDSTFIPRSYQEIQETSMGLMPKEIDDMIWDAVAEADETLFRMMNIL
jgi:hypothetical protein